MQLKRLVHSLQSQAGCANSYDTGCASQMHCKHVTHRVVCACVQIAAAEAAARAEAQELEGWKRDATAVLAALESTHTEKIAEVVTHA